MRGLRETAGPTPSSPKLPPVPHQERRAVFLEQCRTDRLREARITPERLSFIDDTQAATTIAPPGGRAPRREQLLSAMPHGYWKTTTFVAGLRQAGGGRAVGAGPPDERGDLPRLPRAVAGADPLAGRHHDHGQPLGAHGRGDPPSYPGGPAELVHLPPYSPDLNPIENLFARPMALLPKATGRTVSTLWTAIGAPL